MYNIKPIKKNPVAVRTSGVALWYEVYGYHFIAIDFGSRSELVYRPSDLNTHADAELAFDELVQSKAAR